MRKILGTILFVLLFAVSLLATPVTITSTSVSNWTWGGSTCTLKVFASETFRTSSSTTVLAGSPTTGAGAQSFSCTVNGTVITIPAITIDSTTDGTPNSVHYQAWIYDSRGVRRQPLIQDFVLPLSMAPSTTWTGIDVYNRGRVGKYVPNYLDRDQIVALINSSIVSVTQHSLSSDYGNSLATAISTIGASPSVLNITQDTVTSTATIPSNITLNFTGAGKITVSNGQTLTIGSMIDPGNRQIFTLGNSSSHAVFVNAAVDHVSISWFAGNAGGDATRAINECLLSSAANQGGMVITVPNVTAGWTTTGGHILPSSTTIEGVAVNSNALAASRIKMTASGTFMFKISDAINDTEIHHLGLDNNSQTNNVGILFEGTTNATLRTHIHHCSFEGFKDGIAAVPTSGSNWMVNLVTIEHNFFIVSTEASILWHSINGDVQVRDNLFQISNNTWGIKLFNAGAWTISGNEIGGSVTPGNNANWFWAVGGGSYANLNFIGNEDEGCDISFLDESVGVYQTASFTNNIIQGLMITNSIGNAAYYSKGNTYTYPTSPWVDRNTPNAVPDAQLYSEDALKVKTISVANFQYGVDILVSEWRPQDNSGGNTNNWTHIQKFKDRIVEGSVLAAFSSATDPLLEVMSYRDRDLVAWGSSDFFTEQRAGLYRGKFLTASNRLEWRYTHTTGSEQTKGGWTFNNFPLIFTPVRPAQITSDQANYNVGRAGNFLYLNTNATRTITGFTFDNAQTDGQWFVVVNNGSQNIIIGHEFGSTAANRVTSNTGADFTLAPNDNAFFVYDGTAQRWKGSKWASSKSDIGLSNVDNTSDATKNSATATLTNKRVTPRAATFASGATTTLDVDNSDVLTVTALATNTTFAVPSGTPTEGQVFVVRIKDNGTGRTLTWNAIFRSFTATLPATTTANKTVYVVLMYNAVDVKWDCLNVQTQP
jgi:hypothetical protein